MKPFLRVFRVTSVCVELFQDCGALGVPWECLSRLVCVNAVSGEDLCLPKERCDSLDLAMNLVNSSSGVTFPSACLLIY